MSSGHEQRAIAHEAEGVAAAICRLALTAPVILIDGPAGAGKSSLADALVANWADDAGVQLVRMDDLYPGWHGLAAGSGYLRDELLIPLRDGQPAGWRRFDWDVHRRAEWHPIDARRPLIVEGCGTLGAANAARADLRVWIDAADDIRKRRALARDHGGFDPYWDIWQQQFDTFITDESPRSFADLIVDGTPERSDTAAGEPGGATVEA